jgi:hypothetical protein
MKCIYCFFGSDTFANLLTLAGIVIALIGLINLNELVKRYKSKQQDASFGYYTNLDCFLDRIKQLISDDDNKSIGVLGLLSSNKEYKKAAKSDEVMIISAKRLIDVSTNLLDYISNESNLVPPCNNIEEAEEWYKDLKILITYLNCFTQILDGFSTPEIVDKESENQYCKKILDHIIHIQNILRLAINESLSYSIKTKNRKPCKNKSSKD